MESREGNWQEFESWLQELRGRGYRRGLIFRGQANSEWRLETTLERSGHSTMSVADYYELAVRRVGQSISTFSSMQAPPFNDDLWKKLSAPARYEGSIFFDQTVFPGGKHFEYAAHLRHHGFPSPLLDWSLSPYVAAFFAFRDADLNRKIEKRSIFAYCDAPEGIRGGTIGEPDSDSIRAYWNSPQAFLSAVGLHRMRKRKQWGMAI